MNSLVASVIRTLVPVAVGQVASWFLLLHVVLPKDAEAGLATFLGGALTAIYYVAVRVLEQQWPTFGILLGLPSSPDTYSKAVATAAVPEAPTKAPVDAPARVDAPAPVIDAGFQSKIEAAISGSAPAVA
jgi:hypothetical protein